MRSRIGSMGLIELASERYPTGKTAERGGGVPNMSSIFFSISCAWRIDSWYCLHSSSFGETSSEEVKRVPNEAMDYTVEVSQNGALGP